MSCGPTGCRRILPKGNIATLVPLCTPPDIFSDCFTGCLGPAPACGWVPISLPGTVIFDGDLMNMGGPPGTSGRAEKPTFVPIPSGGFTVQFHFTQVPAPATPGTVYSVSIADGAALITDIRFFGTGVVVITFGPVGSQFVGPWAPLAGAPHTAHYSVDGAGVPTLFLDGAPVPLVPGGPFPVPPQTPGTVAAEIDSGTLSVMGSFDYIVAATGIFPPTAVFCCPGGGPVT